MGINDVILIISLCSTIFVLFRIVMGHIEDKRQGEQELREKQKRVKAALKKLDWKQKV
jgi:hypothetical protein